MNIAILGFGTIGTGVFDIIRRVSRLTQDMKVKYILVRKNKKKVLPEMTDNLDEILSDPALDVVVEVMGGIEPAHSYILTALQHHKHVITANKAVIACYLEEFTRVAEENGVKFYFESSVGGGTPWIHGIERAARVDDIDNIQGIFNGTSNFILEQMKKTGASFGEALFQAQSLGYAEADPSADIDGWDVANKLCISCDIAYDCYVKPSKQLPIFGIRNITARDINNISQRGYTVKLIGKSHQLGVNFDYFVEPTLCRTDTLEANTSENYNLISLHGQTVGELRFVGQGAGKFPTANAIIQDILDICQNKSHLQRTFNRKLRYQANLTKGNYIVRCSKNCLSLFGYFAKSKWSDYLLLQQIPVGQMHELMKRVLELDSKAWMASLPNEKEQAIPEKNVASLNKQHA